MVITFQQLISSLDWDPVEVISMKNKNILINILIYKKTVMRRARKMEAMCEELLFHKLWSIFERESL